MRRVHLAAVDDAQNGREPDMVLVPVGTYVDDPFKFRLIDDTEFQGVPVCPVGLIFGEYGAGVRLVHKEQRPCPVLLQRQPVETVQEIGRVPAVLLQQALIQHVLPYRLEMHELAPFVDNQYLVHRAVHHPVSEQQDHRDCHRAEYEHQFRTECMVPPGFRQPGKIPEYVFYIEYVLFLHHNVITIC